jgi:hypothetical protein
MRIEVVYDETHNHDIVVAPPAAFKSVPMKGIVYLEYPIIASTNNRVDVALGESGARTGRFPGRG